MNISLQYNRARFQLDPFDWGVIADVFENSAYQRLLDSFPTDGFVLTEKPTGSSGKSYKTYNLTVVQGGKPTANFETLSSVWKDAILAVVGEANVRNLETMTKRSLTGTAPEVRFVVYSAGCWIGPHLDRPDKRLTQILYLQAAQDHLVGGDLLILGSGDIQDVVERVPPTPNSSVVLLPSIRSWHAVSMLHTGSTAKRRCVLVHFAEVSQ